MTDPKTNPEDPSHIPARAAWADQHLDGWKREKASTWGTCRCKLHDDSTASLRFNLATGAGTCRGCNWQGLMAEYAEAAKLSTLGLPLFEKQEGKTEKRGRKRDLGREVAWYTYRTAEGQPVFQQVRYEPKNFRLKHLNSDGVWKWGRAGLPLIPYRLDLLGKVPAGAPIWWVEGEKDADNGALIGLHTTTTPQGVNSFIHVERDTLQVFLGRVVIFVRDNDPQGKDLSLVVGQALHGIAKAVLLLDLPDLPPKGDLTDWLALHKELPKEAKLKLLYSYLESDHCTVWRPSMLPRQQIEVGDRELHEISEEALKELQRWNDPPQIFCDRAGQIVRVQTIAEETAVAPVCVEALRGYLSESARWMRYKKDGLVPTYPDPAVATDLAVRHATKLPVLEDFTRSPIFDAHLRLIKNHGYDKKSGTYCDLSSLKLPRAVPEDPTQADLAEAKEWLLERMLGDFPFCDSASQAHAVAAILSPFVRQALHGPIPLHVIEAPTAGTGKSLLAQVLALPATGTTPAMMSDPGDDEAEWRKRITSTLMKMPSFIFIDNVSSSLESDTLASALTSTWWEDRILGTNKNVRIPQRACWVATGNNLALKLDIARRTAPIRIDSKQADPWNREGFKIEDIVNWCKENRSRLVWSCLVLIRRWVADGKPRGARKMGSFEGYARVLGGVLGATGIDGFLANYEENFRRSDTASEEWEAFVAAWWTLKNHCPRTVTELAEFMEEQKLLESVIPAGKNPAGRRVSLGKKLQTQIDRIYGGLAIVVHQLRNSNGCREYKVVRVRNDVPLPELPPEPIKPEELTPEDLSLF